MLREHIPAYWKRRIQRLKEWRKFVVKQQREREKLSQKAANNCDEYEIIASLKTIDRKAQRKAERKQSKPLDPVWWQDKRFLLDVIGIIIAGVAGYFIFKQQNIMQGTLAEMQTEQRPWIKVDVTPVSDFIYLQRGENGATVQVQFAISNIGKTPALFVTLEPTQNFAMYDGRFEQREIADAQRKACAAFRADEMPNDANELTIFPGDSPAKLIETYAYSASRIRREQKHSMEQKFPGFTPVVAACVGYRLGGSGKWGITPLSVALTTHTGFIPVGGERTVSLDEIEFRPLTVRQSGLFPH